MKISKIREIAKKNGINTAKMNKTDLIRSIQGAEDSSDCFATPYVDKCNQMNCLWREDYKADIAT